MHLLEMSLVRRQNQEDHKFKAILGNLEPVLKLKVNKIWAQGWSTQDLIPSDPESHHIYIERVRERGELSLPLPSDVKTQQEDDCL